MVLGCTVPSSPHEQLGSQVRSRFLALIFQAGIGLWGPGHAEPGPGHTGLRHPAGWGQGRHMLLATQTVGHTLHCFISNRHRSVGLSMALAQGPQGSCPSRDIRRKSLWQRDNSLHRAQPGAVHRDPGLQHACMGSAGAQPAPHKLWDPRQVPFWASDSPPVKWGEGFRLHALQESFQPWPPQISRVALAHKDLAALAVLNP